MATELLKLESLKLAYETAYKIGLFDSATVYRKDFDLLHDDIEDIFKIADINMRYLKEQEENKGVIDENPDRAMSNIGHYKRNLSSPVAVYNEPVSGFQKFKGMRIKEAVLRYLSEIKGPSRTKEIIEALYSGGVNGDPKLKGVAVNVALNSLKKKGKIKRIERGIWKISHERI